MLPALANTSERKGITAYHGSPHDFDKFDSSNIGKGEGNQAYGHGLYFAESEGVAKHYKKTLSRPRTRKSTNPWDDPLVQDDASAALERAYKVAGENGMKKRALADLDRQIGEARGTDGDLVMHLEEVRNALDGDHVTYAPPRPGKMYQVRINAEPEQFLDWDKRVGQQSDTVQKAIRARAPNIPDDYPLEGAKWLKEPGVAAELKSAGVVGIRYLDGISRDVGEGTSNYVVFDDSLIDIMRKYMNPPDAAPAGLLATDNQQPTQQDFLLELLRRHGFMQ
jgi:hypothetical protein